MRLSGARTSLRWGGGGQTRRSGFIPLIAAAVLGGARTGIGAYQAWKQRKREVEERERNYGRAKEQMGLRQRSASEGEAESRVQRGLAQSGGDASANPIYDAIMAGPRTVGGQQRADTGRQMGLERTDLEQQNAEADRLSKDAYTNSLIGSVTSGVETGMSVYGGIKDFQGAAKLGADTAGLDKITTAAMPPPSVTPSAPPTPESNGMLSPIAPPSSSNLSTAAPSIFTLPTEERRHTIFSALGFGGVNPVDPTHPTSSWHWGAPANPKQFGGR